jgi:hypothetical protein
VYLYIKLPYTTETEDTCSCAVVLLQGFGSLSGEHWLGNEFVFLLTSQRPYNLRVEVTDWGGQQAFSHYDRFYIGSEKQNYRWDTSNVFWAVFLKSLTVGVLISATDVGS